MFENINIFAGDWEPSFILITVCISVVILGFAFIIPRLIFRRQVFSDLLSEYRSTEMGVAVNNLWGFIETCVKNKRKIVDEYLNIFNRDKESCSGLEQWQNTLHYHRRKVSQFYQQVAQLNLFLFKRKLLRSLSKGDLGLIQFIFPIAIIAMSHINRKFSADQIKMVLPDELIPPEIEEIHKSFFKMYKLYKKSVNCNDRNICRKRFYNMITRLTHKK
ncbi:hypothetical protein ES702_04075 [subsurface metagenome]